MFAAVVEIPALSPGQIDDGEAAERICRAALRCFERFGVTKTSIEDIAREAGCARATVYRHFKGKEAIVLETIRREAFEFFSVLARRLEEAHTFEDLVTMSALTAAERVGNHRLVNVLIEAEPQLVLPHVAFGPSTVVDISTEFLAVYVGRLADRGEIEVDDPRELAEWIVRAILSYLITPSDYFDLSNEGQVREMARRFFEPVVRRQPTAINSNIRRQQ